MTRFATKTLVMTAALAAFAIGASAQAMNAEIPFTFRAGDAVLAAGSYRINVSNSVVRVINSDTKKGAMLVPRYRRDAEAKWAKGDPKLWFACTGSSCVLTTLWNGVDPTAMVVASPAHGKAIAETRVVSLTAVKSE